MLKNQIKQIAKEILKEVIKNRQHLHANPELSFQEYNTSAFVKAQLDDLGIEWTAMANTGVVGIIKGEKPSDAVVALRADMDALPITEANQIPFKSTNDGVMHACGHDVHTSSLLGTAKILQRLKSEFGGTVKLIFQPAEEKLPGGAIAMIREGVLTQPQPGAVFGQHVMPTIPAGKVGVCSGKFMASSDEIYITVTGKGGHGAQPQQNIDPVLIASHLIVALQQLVSRRADPRIPSVLSFGKMVADGATNVIPDKVYLEGTFRTMDESWRTEGLEKMKKLASGLAESMDAECDVKIIRGYPYLINDPDLANRFKAVAQDYLGKENVQDLDIWMAAEDFAYYSHEVSSCFYMLGVRNETQNIISSLHTPTFNVDETAIEISTGLMTYVALKNLGN